jgi:hypothetical protein
MKPVVSLSLLAIHIEQFYQRIYTGKTYQTKEHDFYCYAERGRIVEKHPGHYNQHKDSAKRRQFS